MKHLSPQELARRARRGTNFTPAGERTLIARPSTGSSMAAPSRQEFRGSWHIASLLRALWLKI